MARTASLRRLGLVLVGGVLVAAFALNSLYGQPPGFPRRPNMPRPPGFNPPGGGGIGGGAVGGGGIGGGGIGGPVFEYKCSNCGRVVGQGRNSMLDGPSKCPFCGVRFINGGIGKGDPIGGNVPPIGGVPNTPPGFQPQPPVPNPPMWNPPMANPPVVPPPASTSGSSSGSGLTVVVVVAVVVVGLLLFAGGAWLMIVSFKDAAPSQRKRRRRVRYDDEEY
jgi:DNA-directed RNA polymerase subunit RPC12/RpoP